MEILTFNKVLLLTSFISSIYPTYYYLKNSIIPFENLYKMNKNGMFLDILNKGNNLDSKPYNYYVFSIQKWCGKDYQIHGLWPQYDTNSYPTYCSAPTYVNVDGDLYDEMNTYWNNCGDEQSFWDHEYTKHLSCVYEQYGLKETDSFQLTLNLFKEFTFEDFEKCDNQSDCIVGCFDLDLNKITCP